MVATTLTRVGASGPVSLAAEMVSGKPSDAPAPHRMTETPAIQSTSTKIISAIPNAPISALARTTATRL
ncbi:hypothetical protein D3C86_1863040 [compost metagenome]